MDDASSNNTRDLITKWQRDNNIHIEVIFQANQEKISAIKQGIAASSTESFTIVDSDDILLPETVQVIIDTYSDDNPSIENGNLDIAGYISFKRNITENHLICHQQSFLMRRSL